MNKNKYIVQYPNTGRDIKTILQGNKKEISKSKMMNRIPIKKNLTSNFWRESPYGSKPHSYTETFSGSGFLTANKYEAPTIIKAKITATKKNQSIG